VDANVHFCLALPEAIREVDPVRDPYATCFFLAVAPASFGSRSVRL
jgi:hypothetical protein